MLDVSALLQKRAGCGRTRFIAIDGRGGSGKSTLAGLLADRLGAEIVHTNDFATSDNQAEWHPQVIEKVFAPILRGADVLRYAPTKWWPDHLPQPVSQPVTPIMILEGVSALRREFRPYISVGVFVETPRSLCLRRGIARDLKTGTDPEEIERLWTRWADEEDRYFARDAPWQFADAVIDGSRPFETQLVRWSRAASAPPP